MNAMTPEKRFDCIDKQIEFLARHQAGMFASMESLREVSARHEAEVMVHTGQIAKVADVVVSLARIVEEQGRRTDELLNAQIKAVERHIAGGHRHDNQ